MSFDDFFKNLKLYGRRAAGNHIYSQLVKSVGGLGTLTLWLWRLKIFKDVSPTEDTKATGVLGSHLHIYSQLPHPHHPSVHGAVTEPGAGTSVSVAPAPPFPDSGDTKSYQFYLSSSRLGALSIIIISCLPTCGPPATPHWNSC